MMNITANEGPRLPPAQEKELKPQEDNDQIQKIKYIQWSSLPAGKFVPALNTVSSLPAGLYELKYESQYSSVVLNKKGFNLDDLYELPTYEIGEILNDIKKFWDNKLLFKEYNYVHKRGILLYGKPGCGKSGIIQICVKYLIEQKNGIIINIKNSDDVENYTYYISTIREIEKERPFIVIMEDIDSILGDNKYATSQVLNILDGINQIGDVVYIATTNYPEKIEERITNRPSRFDRRYEISLPNSDIRRAYFINKLGKSFKDIDLWTNETDGMSLAHLKELVISTILLGNPFKESINKLRELEKEPIITDDSTNTVGFK